MFSKIFKTTKKAILLSTAGIFTLLAVSNTAQSSSTEVPYILQGASKATMVELVKQVGGEVIHDYSVIDAVSASLTHEQVSRLTDINPMLRMMSKAASQQTAGFVWPPRSKRINSEFAGFVWPPRSKRINSEFAGFVWPPRSKRINSEFAGFVWPPRSKRYA